MNKDREKIIFGRTEPGVVPFFQVCFTKGDRKRFERAQRMHGTGGVKVMDHEERISTFKANMGTFRGRILSHMSLLNIKVEKQ